MTLDIKNIVKLDQSRWNTIASTRFTSLTKRCIYKIILSLTLALGEGHMYVTQYSLHHVTCAPAKIEFATYKGLGGDAFENNTLFTLTLTKGHTNHNPVPSTSNDLCISKVAMSNSWEAMYLQENTLFLL